MESLDIALKGIKAVFIYDMLMEGVPKSNGICLTSKTFNVSN